MTHVYLTDSDVNVIVDFVKDHEYLYVKPSEHFKHKAKKEFLWEQFTKSCKLSVNVCKTKDTLREADTVKVWTYLKGDDGTSDLDTGQVRMPEVAHQMQRAQQGISLN